MKTSLRILYILFFISQVNATKNVVVSLQAQWNHTSFVAEASEYLASEDKNLFWRYLDQLADAKSLPSDRSHEAEYEVAYKNVVAIVGEARSDLIKLALALRIYSPRVSVFRQMGQDEHADCDTFVVVNNHKLCDLSGLDNALTSGDNSWFLSYTFDHIYEPKDENKPFAVLYCDLGTEKCSTFHKKLVSLAKVNKIQYVFRHYSKETEVSGVGLSGYGAELAIKNTEYKAVDDSQHNNADFDEEKDRDIHGLDFNVLRKNHPDSVASLKQLKRHLSDLEELTPLKQWEVSDLSYQAAYKIISAEPERALNELTDVSQNFPIRARSLVNVKVPQDFRQEVRMNQKVMKEDSGISEGENAFYVNGISVDVEQLDVFQLYETVLAEEKLASVFYNMGFRREYLSLLYQQKFIEEKANFAIDYREAYPEYLNNLDKDKQYKDWGNSVKALLQPTYMGMLRPIARNFFTLIFVVDPASPEAKNLLSVGHSLYIHRVPIRIGYVFVVNDDKTVSGLTDTGVALLNLYNFAKSDRKSVPKAIDLLVKCLEIISSNPSAEAVHNFFKKKFHGEDINDVFQADSDYDTGRTAGAAFLRRSLLEKAPKVMLNGIILDDASVTPDRIEEAILMQIMRQTNYLQRSVMMGKLTDRDNVQNWVMSQPEVLPRLNRRFLETPDVVVVHENVYPCAAKTEAEIAKIGQSELNQCVLERVKHFTREGGDKTRWLTLWLVVDFDSKSDRWVALNALKALKRSKTIRLAFIQSGSAKSQVNKFVHGLIEILPSEAAKEVLTKKLNDEAWLIKASKNVQKLEELKVKDLDVSSFKKEFAALSNFKLKLENEFAKRVVGEKKAAVIVNGEVYGPLKASETLEVEDIFLLEHLAKQRGAVELADAIDKLDVPAANDKSSDVLLRAWSAFAKYAVKKERRQLSLASDSESVLYLLAGDQKRGILDLTLVVDSLSKGAQRLSAVVASLTRVLNCDIKIVMNPKAKLSELPLKRFFRFSLNEELLFDTNGKIVSPALTFSELPNKQLLTLNIIPPDAWMVQPVFAKYDLDNIKMESVAQEDVVAVYELVHILLEGHCFDVESGSPPRGLQFILGTQTEPAVFDTIVMANLGYFQLKASPGAWILQLREGKSRGIYSIHNHTNTESEQGVQQIRVVIDSFLGRVIRVRVGKLPGKENEGLLSDSGAKDEVPMFAEEEEESIWSSIQNKLVGGDKHEQINIFSLASGHLYERFMRIMIVSVVKNTKHPVKFWLLNNYLSPQFRESLPKMAKYYGFDFELVEYKWPRWLHQQSEKQRIMWGYKILFLDVLFPLNIKKIIFVDADQVVRTDMMELMNFDLGGAPYGYTPFCDSRSSMEGFRFWKKGYWSNHLAGRRYHISALYVVDLAKFRQIAAGDRLRGQYQGLSADPNSLSNLDQDLPNNMIHQVRIKSLPQEWLWCETWCSDETKKQAKTIDLCNNPETKEPKLDSAMRIIPEWTEYDTEIKKVLSGELTPKVQQEEDSHAEL
ncbi:unnamed protein product [Bursaphelenchus okinawaensis]|uniref:UDP-glucose:glycoprotein glucosyltransferase n=1 Tax=Bursaphelenchus okinawaensis TaxID=465554 RepID=A0A811LQZ7_9BILA|nr:unnamed protein product [Bursaphelenchus okinawaensis]CAG9126238.1 unnamed protein product [Bursaphelenchus okinawaensis]